MANNKGKHTHTHTHAHTHTEEECLSTHICCKVAWSHRHTNHEDTCPNLLRFLFIFNKKILFVSLTKLLCECDIILKSIARSRRRKKNNKGKSKQVTGFIQRLFSKTPIFSHHFEEQKLYIIYTLHTHTHMKIHQWKGTYQTYMNPTEVNIFQTETLLYFYKLLPSNLPC